MGRSSSATHDLSLPVAGDRPSVRPHVHAWRHESTAESSSLRWHPSHFRALPSSLVVPVPAACLRPSRRACAKVAPLWWYGRARLPHFHSYPPRPFARAHARPRSSPDWMALCQPATAIALICSSSPRCPSPCVYTSVPLSSLGSTHSQF